MADNEKIALDLRNDLKEIYGFTDEELEGDDMTEPKEVEPVAAAPKTIWLQVGDEPISYVEAIDDGDISWCADKVFEYDIEYRLVEPNTTAIPTAEYEQLKADAELLDWLSDKNQNIGNVELPTECVVQNLHSLRDAIRCAKAKYQARGK